MIFGKKVAFFVGKYAERVRLERKGRNDEVGRSPNRRGRRKKPKRICQRKARAVRIRQPPRIGCTSSLARTTRCRLPKDVHQGAKTITIANVAVPPAMIHVAHARKHRDGGRWILTSKRGSLIAAFESEAELDRWWQVFQAGQGRKPRALRVGRRSQNGRNRSLRPRRHGKLEISRGDYLKPWSDRFDMPEIDLE